MRREVDDVENSPPDSWPPDLPQRSGENQHDASDSERDDEIPFVRRQLPFRVLVRRPVWAVWLMVAINVIIGVLLEFSSPQVYLDAIESFAHKRSAVWSGEYYRLITATFLHGGPQLGIFLLHLGGNTLLLILVGRTVERWMGAWRFLAVYMTCGLAGSLFFQATSGQQSGLGASGAILGIVGVFLIGSYGENSERGVVAGKRLVIASMVLLGLVIIEPLILANSPLQVHVALSAHLGGLFAGTLCGYLCFVRRPAGENRRRAFQIALAGSLVAIGTYGIFMPIGDWVWHFHHAQKGLEQGADDSSVDEQLRKARLYGGDPAALAVLGLLLENDLLDKGLAYWIEEPPEDEDARRFAGYICFGALWAEGLEEDADAVLVKLTEMVEYALEEKRTAELLNESAWYRSLREVDLPTALKRAEEVIALAPGNGLFLNTLGWVQFKMGDEKKAIETLETAANLTPCAENCLFAGVARFYMGDLRAAKLWVQNAHHFEPPTTPYEKALLEKLSEDVGYQPKK